MTLPLESSFTLFDSKAELRLTDGSDLKVRICSQGGGVTIARLNPIIGRFTRVIDGTGTANVTGQIAVGKNGEAASSLRDISTARQELEFAFGNDVIWAGPIQYVSWQGGVVSVEAEDNTSWWASRALSRINISVAHDLSDIVEIYHNAAMAIDPIVGFNLIKHPAGDFSEAIVEADDKRMARDAIDEIADFGLDYTAIGRNVLIGPPSAFPQLQYRFNDDSFVEAIKVEELGPRQGFCTRLIAFSERQEEPVIVEAAPHIVAAYGIIERVVEFRQLTDREDLTKAALAYLDTFSNPLYIASESTLTLRSGLPLSVNELLPGSRAEVFTRRSGRVVKAILRIREVQYNLTTHSFSVSLEPTSAPFGGKTLSSVVEGG